MLPPAVLWVDPGMMTGLAFYQSQQWHPDWQGPEPTPLPRFSAAEYPFSQACRTIEQVCAGWTNRLAIGWERFTINASTHKKTLAGTYDALHVIGVCRHLAAKYECRVLPEAQQATPTPQEQRQLKALGWWVPSKDDAQSAAAHLLRYMQRSGELPAREQEVLSTLGR